MSFGIWSHRPFLVLLLLIPVTLPSLQSSATPGNTEEFEARVDSYLEPFLATGNFSGSLLIAHQG